MSRFPIILIIVTGVAAAALALGYRPNDVSGPLYRFATVDKGDLVTTVTAAATVCRVVALIAVHP